MIDFKDTLPMSEPARTVRVGHRQAPMDSALAVRPHGAMLRLPVTWLESALLLMVLGLLALSVWTPAVAQPEDYHQFADRRAWAAVPFAMDVLSNGGFLAAGLWGLWKLGRLNWVALSGPVWVSAVLFFGGMAFTGVGSALYHWQPDATGLMLDRMAMGVAFAGLLGLAVADRVSGRAALCIALGVLLVAPVAAALAWRGNNATPWLVLQMGGLLVLLALAAIAPLGRHQGGTWGLPLLSVVVIYALAKVFELADHAVFDLTQGWVSGHTLKHLVAAGVVWPVWHGLSGCSTAGRMPHAPVRRRPGSAPHCTGGHLVIRPSKTTAQVRPS